MGLVARKTTVLLGGAAMAMVVGIVSAAAQDAAPGDAVTNQAERRDRVTLLQRLVVGAGQEKVAIDTPQAVSVIEQEEIDQRQPDTIGDVLRGTPGVNVTGSDRLLGQSFNIRGIGAPENSGDGGRIIVNVDGVNKFYEQYRMGSFFSDPELYRRVEVLRGPASSTLYGSGALGGVINFETKDASDFIADGDTGALRLKSGWDSNGNGWLFSSVLAQRFGDDAEFLLAGNYRFADTYKTGDGTELIGSNFRAWSGLAKATFNVGDEGKLRVSYQHWDSDLDRQQLSQTSTATFFGLVDRHVIDRTGIVAYENPFSDNDMADVRVSLSYSDTSNKQRNADLRPACSPGSFAIVCDSDYAYQTWQLNAQNTMEWRGDNWENFFTFGSQSAYQTRVADSYFNTGVPFPVTFHPEGTDLRTGVFAQNEFIWDERLTLIPGVRLDWRRLSPDANVIDPFTGLTAATTDDTAISPKIAAHYRVNDTLALFGSIAHTERFPTIDEVFSTASSSSTFLPSLDLRKEKSNNFEVGFALSGYDLAQPGDAVQFKATAFYNDVTDLIALDSPFTPGFNNRPGFRNINRAELYGFELESAYDSDYVFANAAYSYVVGKDRATGDYLQTIAPHELALTLGGKLPDYGLRFGWTARIVADPQDRTRRSDTPIGTSTRYAKAFDVHDVFVSWTPEEGQLAGWQANFGVDNIFNRQYKEFLENDAAKGRTFKVSLSKQIGW
ncbi:TonB-dependent hemoglobin/transferrin/lactoferrin family receptor [Mesorhizobium microcysteis]|uniref:TonB-dependent hemoglobin/transferrin/lactoferrin family receptor n=1 Tax=Neoaquamicrobium microcysteis TaxID=2682781 RepID=A0A5D4GWW6_9HYPH|nr:TonB-dependent hemoglobin/transferrin/lactoferrin family receptor [Mesorhizobium microcysteis]TYR32473.1 TonB-dependent hemoglobin/transferrin/lactoferrin family receptor [Mesorhizobium microcysteis]